MKELQIHVKDDGKNITVSFGKSNIDTRDLFYYLRLIEIEMIRISGIGQVTKKQHIEDMKQTEK